MTSGPSFVHAWRQDGRVVTFSWLGDEDVAADRVYAFAFISDGRMLLVSVDGARFWLPGGGVEKGETPEDALARELEEEAAASVVALEKLGAQLAEDSGGESSYQAFYWCRITLNEVFAPQHEITERRLVAPDTFLDALFWGRSDPKADLLLTKALECEWVHTGRGRA